MSHNDACGDELDTNRAGPLPNRFTRATLLGCVGILCVLALPALLAVPLEMWRVPGWLQRLVPLCGVGLCALGVWFLARVPAAQHRRSTDPLHPLTGDGRAPIVERPATVVNRVGVVVVVGLCCCGLAGYMLVSFGHRDGASAALGTLLAGVAGVGLILYGVLAALQRVALPALRWTNSAIQGGVSPQAILWVLIGCAMVSWALLVATDAGYVWAPIGVGMMIMGGVLAVPVFERLRGGLAWRRSRAWRKSASNISGPPQRDGH